MVSPDRWDRVQSLFFAALDLPEEARERFLAGSCDGDAALSGEIRRLLEQDSAGDSRLSSIVASVARTVVASQAPSLAGTRLGAYHLTRELARGGMGTVYLATRADEQFHQQVAIKVINRELDSEATRSRFRQERQVLANLQHPNIARLLDGGATPDGHPFFAMEYIEGVSITEYARNLDVAGTLGLFFPVCSALEYAHRKLVVHRDLKPGNVLITADGRPKLLDFGIARLLDSAAEDWPFPKATAMTPHYASPEQIRGEPATTASDTYSLGALLYELLARRCPFDLPSAPASDLERAICEQTPVLPSAACADSRRAAELRGDLDAIVTRAMHKDPQSRYVSVDALHRDLCRHLEFHPVEARTPTWSYRAGRYLRRHRLAVTAVAAVVLTAAAGATLAIRSARLADRRFHDVRHLADSILFEFHDSIRALPGSTQARALMVHKGLDYLNALNRDSAGDPSLLREIALAYLRVGEIQGQPDTSNLGDTSGARRSYRQAIAILQGLLGRDPADTSLKLDLARAYTRLAVLENTAGDLTSASAAVSQGLPLVEPVASSADGRTAAAGLYQVSGRIAVTQGALVPAFENASRARDLYAGLLRESPERSPLLEGLAYSSSTLGGVYMRRNELPQALAAYRENLAIRERLAAAAPQSMDALGMLMIAYSHIADITGSPSLTSLGDRQGALPYYEKMLEIARRRAAMDALDRNAQLDLMIAEQRAGVLFIAMGRLADGGTHLALSEKAGEALVSVDPSNARILNNLAFVHLREGEVLAGRRHFGPAIVHLERSIALNQSVTSRDPRNLDRRRTLLRSYQAYGRILAAAGEKGRALPAVREIRKIADSYAAESAVIDQVQRPFAYSTVAEIYLALGDRASAVSWYRQSLQLWEGFAQLPPRFSTEPAKIRAALAALK